jgi:hypothetical protein
MTTVLLIRHPPYSTPAAATMIYGFRGYATDFLKVVVTGAGQVKFTNTNFGGNDSYGYLYDNAGTLITSDDDSAGNRLWTFTPTLAPGTYWVGMSTFGGLMGPWVVRADPIDAVLDPAPAGPYTVPFLPAATAVPLPPNTNVSGVLTAPVATSGTAKFSAWAILSSAIDLPVPSFSATPTAGVFPLAVTFTDTSTWSPTSWLWDFGDGVTSTAQNPSHTYTTPGKYNVTLTVTNANGSDSLTKTAYINAQIATAPFLTPVLDDFNRAGTALGSNWAQWASEAMMRINPRGLYPNVLVGGDTSSTPASAVWVANTFLNSEVYATVLAAPNSDGLFLLLRGSLSASPTGYIVQFNYLGGTSIGASMGVSQLSGMATNTFSRTIGTSKTITMSASGYPFEIGARVYDRADAAAGLYGVQIEAWVRPKNGVWTKFHSVLDTASSRITTAGYLGIGAFQGIGGQADQLDNFGGGAIAALPDFTFSADALPGLTGAVSQRGAEHLNHAQRAERPVHAQLRPQQASIRVGVAAVCTKRSIATTRIPPLYIWAKPNRDIANKVYTPTFHMPPYVSAGGTVVESEVRGGGGISIY